MPNHNAALPARRRRVLPNPLHLLAEWGVFVAFCLIGGAAALYIAAYAILTVRLPLNRVTLAGALLLIIVLLLLWIWKNKAAFVSWRLTGSAMLAAGICIGVSVWAAGHIYDTSYDGQVYHMFAVSALHDGWNPLYAPNAVDLMWVKHYPKGAWLTEAAIYTLTGYVETGKALNLIAMAASCFAAFGALLKVLAVWGAQRRGESGTGAASNAARITLALLLAACAGMNPVIVTQLFTYYNDGLIGSLLLLMIGAAVYYTLTYERKALALAAICVILLVNIKFTAIAYAGLLCASLVIAVAVRHWIQRHGDDKKPVAALLELFKAVAIKKATIVLLASVIVGMGVLGWNPYMFNTFNYGHPLYPLAGKHPVDIMTLNSPQNFIHESRWKTFFVSYTSRTEDVVTPRSTERARWWPIPWQDFDKVNVDTRVAGFGPLSPWLLAGTLALGVLIAVLRWRIGLITAVVAAALLSTVFINPEPWWARYVPQLWLVPLAVITAGWCTRSTFVRAAALFLLLICSLDAYKSANFILHLEHDQSKEVKAHLSELEDKQIRLYPAEYASESVRMKEWGVAFRIAGDDERPCKKPLPVPYATSLYCIEPGE